MWRGVFVANISPASHQRSALIDNIASAVSRLNVIGKLVRKREFSNCRRKDRHFRPHVAVN